MTLVRLEDLLRYRDRRFRRLPHLRVRGERSALQFVNDVGFCSTFARFPEGVPCLWEAVAGRRDPRWPRHSHHDAGVGLTWELKEVLPARRHVYYGKLLKSHPCLVSLDLFPAFYALIRGRQRGRHYREEYETGRLSLTARRLMDGLSREHPLYTRDLRAQVFMLEPSRTREFERAMGELQQGLWVVKTEERYEPTFSYRWDLLEEWLPAPVREGRRLQREKALEMLVGKFLEVAGYVDARSVARLFRLGREETERTIGVLARSGALLTDQEIVDLPGRWLISTRLAPKGGARGWRGGASQRAARKWDPRQGDVARLGGGAPATGPAGDHTGSVAR